jgi:hypothetical protein
MDSSNRDRDESPAPPSSASPSPAPSSSQVSFSLSTRSDPFQLGWPFTQLGPVEWSCHGLQARAANSLNHGNQRYWVTYCPSSGTRAAYHGPRNFCIDWDARPDKSYTAAARIYYPQTASCRPCARWHHSPTSLARLACCNVDRIPRRPSHCPRLSTTHIFGPHLPGLCHSTHRPSLRSPHQKNPVRLSSAREHYNISRGEGLASRLYLCFPPFQRREKW